MQMIIPRTKVSKKWQIVLPKEARKELEGVKPGKSAWVKPLDKTKVVVSFKNPIEEGVGLLKSRKSLTKALLYARKKERAREKTKFKNYIRS